MKTTLEIDEGVMRELKARAAREGRTMSELVETALRALLAERPAPVELPPLPVFNLGGLWRIADSREQLYEFFDGTDAEPVEEPRSAERSKREPKKNGGR